MILKKPSLEDTFQFIKQTHEVENIKLSYLDVEKTYQKKIKNEYAFGHLHAFSYGINKLVTSYDYPLRNNNMDNLSIFENNISWLKTLHSFAFSPVISLKEINLDVTKIGDWRKYKSYNVFSECPPPEIIPHIMFNWLNKLNNIHKDIKKNIDNPTAIPKESIKNMGIFINEQPYFFSTVQPFFYGNNRFGRLVQNIICVGWNLPIRSNITNTYEDFKSKLEEYQRVSLPEVISEGIKTKSKI